MTDAVLGFDVGGSTVRAGVVDVARGCLLGEMVAAATPQPATPAALIGTFAALLARLPPTAGRIGIAFPSVVRHGVTHTAAHIDAAWLGAQAERLTAQALGRPVLYLNDADAAGIAEMRFGSGRGCEGTVVMLTFGTGIGTALFTRGVLFPNTELGHLELRGSDAEEWASARARTAGHLDFAAWSARVNDYLTALHRLLWPEVLILGGAVSEHYASFAPLLRVPAELRPARFTGQAGVIGAALAAADGT